MDFFMLFVIVSWGCMGLAACFTGMGWGISLSDEAPEFHEQCGIGFLSTGGMFVFFSVVWAVMHFVFGA